MELAGIVRSIIKQTLILAIISITASNIKGHAISTSIGQYEPGLAFAAGMVARGVTTAIGFHLAGKVFDQQRVLRGINMTEPYKKYFVEDLFETLTGLDLAIVAWTTAHLTFKPVANVASLAKTVSPSDLVRSKTFDLGYLNGMDTWYTYTTLLSLYAMLKKYSSRPTLADYKALIEQTKDTANSSALIASLPDEELWQGFQQRETLASFSTGLLTSYLNFMFAEYVASKACGKEWYNEGFKTKVSAVLIIFNIGITLNALTKAIYFGLRDETLSACHACDESFKGGDDLAYVLSGVIPGWMAFYKNLMSPKVKTA